MLQKLREWGKSLPTLFLAFILALAVWTSATLSADPNVERTFPRAIPIQIIGQDPGLVIVGDHPTQVTVTIKAPQSIWTRLVNEDGLITATADLSGLSAGTHMVDIQVQVAIRPYELISVTPKVLNLTMENFSSITLPVHLVRKGEPAVGFQAGTTELSTTEIKISGPESLVQQVKQITANLDITGARENINSVLPLQALDAQESPISGVTLSPDKVTVTQPITQRGGYRNVVVKATVRGQVANGYRLTNISVFPPAVTLFSTNPQTVNDLPGFVETLPLNLDGAKDDLDVHLSLNLPQGVSIVGDQTVLVQVGIAAIEGSLTFSNLTIEITGLPPDLGAEISPSQISVILSGPLPVLDRMSAQDVHAVIDVSSLGAGTYQLTPRIELNSQELRVESIIPGTVEVVIKHVATPSPSPTPTRTPRP